jgi:starch-binding outer membrane protein, SusD/RagB family
MAKRKNNCLLYILVIAVCASACTDYLNVEPKDQYLQEKVFKQRETIEKALQGIYQKLASPQLYGHTLSLGAVDVMGQYYACAVDHQLSGFQQYNYSDSRAETTFSAGWKEAYAVILNINSFIEQLKPSKGVISEQEQKQYLGEVYGLRAMLHFDLLRLFGPVYTENANASAIPYQTAPQPTVQPIKTAHAVAERVMADIDTAVTYLSEDPIRSGETDVQLHNRRFNYYAALALDARASLYIGNKERALNRAKELIAEAPRRFPWTPKPGQNEMVDIDPLFSSEIIFRLDQPTLQQQYLNNFDPRLPTQAFLSPLRERLQEVFESNPNDIRYAWSWRFAPNQFGVIAPVFIKYELHAPDYVPLFRISESFLIAAECEPTSESAFVYLDSLNVQRNAHPDNHQHIQLEKVLLQTYQKEFWGEGQLFFYFKRRYLQQIPDGNIVGDSLAMSTAQYVVPIPKDELIQR